MLYQLMFGPFLIIYTLIFTFGPSHVLVAFWVTPNIFKANIRSILTTSLIGLKTMFQNWTRHRESKNMLENGWSTLAYSRLILMM